MHGVPSGTTTDSPLTGRRRFLTVRNQPIGAVHAQQRRQVPRTTSRPRQQLNSRKQSTDRAQTPTPPDPAPTPSKQPSGPFLKPTLESTPTAGGGSSTTTTRSSSHDEEDAEVALAHANPAGAASSRSNLALNLPTCVTDALQVGRIVGDGNFAVVHVCTDRRSGARLALKVISRERCAGKEDLVQNEICLLKRVNHEHVVSVFLRLVATALRCVCTTCGILTALTIWRWSSCPMATCSTSWSPCAATRSGRRRHCCTTFARRCTTCTPLCTSCTGT